MEAIAPSTEALFIMSSVVIPWLAQLQRDIQSDVTDAEVLALLVSPLGLDRRTFKGL